MHEVLRFFTRSSSPDRVKENCLCALCASVVKKNSEYRQRNSEIAF
jgi:hypothetical protein